MAVYSYYYGAHVSRGIGVQAQSPEIEKLPFRAALKELASMHALKSAEHDNEMLSYMLMNSGYSILGASYVESPKSSGYSRSAPCGLMYVTPGAELAQMAGELSRIINFINFQKPTNAAPAPLNGFPLNDSGYSYHNSPAVMSALVEGMLRVVFSGKDVLLIALPKGKNSEYATARYAMAEALGYLPAIIRPNIRFFTGLPVAESDTDPLVGFDNAVKFGANVIFCPNEYFAKLKSHRSCIALDMDAPAAQVGAFAEYITRVADPSAALALVNSRISGQMSVDALNMATQRVRRGDVVTIETVQNELHQKEAYCKDLEKQLRSVNQGCMELQRRCDQLTRENEALTMQRGPYATSESEEKEDSKMGALFWVLTGVCAVVLVVLTVFITTTVMSITGSSKKPEATATPTVTITQTIDELPSPEPGPGEDVQNAPGNGEEE